MVGSTNTMISKKGKFLVPKTHDVYDWKTASIMEFNTYMSVAVVWNNEIHVMGGNGSPANTSAYQHWKWDGTTWTKVGTLPYYFYGGQAVVYNNEIHIMGCSAVANNRSHYKYNGTQWVSVSTLPYELEEGHAVVYKGAIHIMGTGDGYSTSPHYKWDGTSWTRVGTFPYEFSEGGLIVHEGKMHAIGTRSNALRRNHYVFNDDTSTWVKDTDLPDSFYDGAAFSIDDEIHLVGGHNTYYHRKFDGSNWLRVSDLPMDFAYAPAVFYQGTIHMLGGNSNRRHYVWNVQNNRKSFNFLLPYGAKVTGSTIKMDNFSLIQADANPASTFSHVKTTSPLDISFTADNSKPFKVTLGNDILYTNGVN